MAERFCSRPDPTARPARRTWGDRSGQDTLQYSIVVPLAGIDPRSVYVFATPRSLLIEFRAKRVVSHKMINGFVTERLNSEFHGNLACRLKSNRARRLSKCAVILFKSPLENHKKSNRSLGRSLYISTREPLWAAFRCFRRLSLVRDIEHESSGIGSTAEH